MKYRDKLVPEAVYKMTGNRLTNGYYGVLRLPGIPSIAYTTPIAHRTPELAKESAKQVLFSENPTQKQILITFVKLHLDVEHVE